MIFHVSHLNENVLGSISVPENISHFHQENISVEINSVIMAIEIIVVIIIIFFGGGGGWGE